MYEFLKAIAASNNWPFEYARTDFQNLFEEVEQENVSHIFLDPVEIRDIDNDSGVTEKKAYSGSFLIVYSSDIDEEDYDTRYQKYIKPIVEGDLQTIKDSLRCAYEATFKLWRSTEVINVFDYNFDGILCTYEIILDVVEAPVYLYSEVENEAANKLLIYYDKELDSNSLPDVGDYTVNDGEDNPVVLFEMSERMITLTLTNEVENGDTVVFSYTSGSNPLRGAKLNECANLANKSVTNNVQNDANNAANIQIARILADGGTVVDESHLRNTLNTIYAQGLEDSIQVLTDANFGVKKDGGGAVSKLYDISGNDNDPLQTAGSIKPIWTAAQQNGKAEISYTSNQYLETNPLTINQPFFYQVVAKCNVDSGVHNFLIATDSGLASLYAAPTIEAILINAGTALLGTARNTLIKLYEGAFNGLTSTFYDNGSQVGAAADVGTGYYDNASMLIGVRNTPRDLGWNGKIYTVNMYSAIPTTTQRQAMEALFDNYYNVYP